MGTSVRFQTSWKKGLGMHPPPRNNPILKNRTEYYTPKTIFITLYFSPHWFLLLLQVVNFDKTRRNWARLTSLVIITRNMFFLTSVFMRCLRANSNSLVFSLAANDVASNSLSILSNDEPVIHQRPTSKSILLRLSICRFLSLSHWNTELDFLMGISSRLFLREMQRAECLFISSPFLWRPSQDNYLMSPSTSQT